MQLCSVMKDHLETGILVELLQSANLESHFAGKKGEIAAWKENFSQLGFVKMDGFIPVVLAYLMELEVLQCLREVARRHDIQVSSTGNSPRKYMSCGRKDIFRCSRVMTSFYEDLALFDVLCRITNDEVIKAPFEPEEIVINCMQKPEDEHGWHWDDYQYSLLWILRAPRKGNGGLVEFVPNTAWDKENPRIEEYLRQGPIYREYIPQGTFYLINGAQNMHRVSPLKEYDLRLISCFSYASASERDRVVSHESMEEIYSL